MTVEPIGMTNLFIDLAGLTLAVLGLLLSFMLRINNKIERRYFIVLFTLLSFYTASDLSGSVSLTLLGENYALLSKISIFLSSLTSSLLMPVLAAFILYLGGDKFLKQPYFYIETIVCV